MSAPARKVSVPRPLDHQVPILTSPARFKVACCGRRFGKTFLGLIAVLVGHGPRRGKGHWKGALDGGVIWWVTKSDKVARKVWRDLKRALKDWPDLRKREDERRVEFPGGGLIEVRSAHDPESLRGDGLDGVVIDEAAFCHADTWTVLRPALADKQGWTIFISTPNGHNWFHDEFRYAETDPEYARWHLPSSSNPTLTPNEIDAMRRKMGSFKFARECLAQFVVAGGGMFQRSWFKFYDRDALEQNLVVFVAADLATTKNTWSDYSAATAVGKAADGRLYVLDMLRVKLEGPEIVAALRRFMDRYNARALILERAGSIVALNQIARAQGLNVVEVPLGKGIDKTARALPLSAAIESGRMLFPAGATWLEDAIDECCAFPDPSSNDDQVDALGLMVAASPPRGGSGSSPPPPKPRPQPREEQRRWTIGR